MIKLLIDECLTPDLLDYVEEHPDLVNQLIEIDEGGRITVTAWPSAGS